VSPALGRDTPVAAQVSGNALLKPKPEQAVFDDRRGNPDP